MIYKQNLTLFENSNNKIGNKSNTISRHKELVHHAQKDETLRHKHVTAEGVSFFRHTHWDQMQGCIALTVTNKYEKHN